MAQHEFEQFYPQPGWVEHDPTEILTSQLSCAVEALGRAGARPRDMAAIGITNQRETAIVWERATGKADSSRHRLAGPPHGRACASSLSESGVGETVSSADRPGARPLFLRHQGRAGFWTTCPARGRGPSAANWPSAQSTAG